MADLTALADYRNAFYRKVGTVSSDDALVENGETAGAVADLCLTHGFRTAQRFLISHGQAWRWVKRSTAITWSGTEAADGGRYSALPSDFLMLAHRGKSEATSAIREANGEGWGYEIDFEHSHERGNFYYLKNERLYITRGANPPATVYLEYVFQHPAFADAVTVDFPLEIRELVIAYAAQHGASDSWYPRADTNAIAQSVNFWEKQGALFAKRSRNPRKQTAPKTAGTRYFA
jgi:hypothetical protein